MACRRGIGPPLRAVLAASRSHPANDAIRLPLMKTFTAPLLRADTRVAAARDAQVAWRTWGDETVVHHALSNDSYRLAEPAGALLQTLAGGEATTPARLAAAQGLDPEAVESTLRTLIDLNLVVRC